MDIVTKFEIGDVVFTKGPEGIDGPGEIMDIFVSTSGCDGESVEYRVSMPGENRMYKEEYLFSSNPTGHARHRFLKEISEVIDICESFNSGNCYSCPFYIEGTEDLCPDCVISLVMNTDPCDWDAEELERLGRRRTGTLDWIVK